jgi:hypothetical protein
MREKGVNKIWNEEIIFYQIGEWILSEIFWVWWTDTQAARDYPETKS